MEESQVRLPVAYARISQDRYGAGINARTQMKDMRALAARLGLPEPDELIDNDVSAYSRRKVRPGYRELRDGLRTGRWDTLLIWHPDRLHRQPRELEGFMDLVLDHHVRIHTVKAGDDWDIESPDGQMMARFEGALAQRESAHKSARLKRKAAYMIAEGKTVGGPRIFGWEDDQKTIRRSEADIVTELTDRIIAGESLNGLARELNQRGTALTGLERLKKKRDRLTRDIAGERDDDARAGLGDELTRTEEKISRYDATWNATMVHHIVARSRNCGLQVRQTRDRHGKVTGREVTDVIGGWEPILPRERWELAEAILNDPSRSTIREGRRDKLLLTGLMKCGKCGDTVKAAGSSVSRDRSRYGCRSCFGVNRNQELCDELVLRVMEYALDGLEVKAHEPGAAPVDDPGSGEDELTVRRTKLAELFAQGVIDEAALKAGTAKIQAQLRTVRRDRAVSRKPRASRGITGKMLRQMPAERQRPVLRELAEITLLPQSAGGRFDPEALRIVPRDATDAGAFADALARAAREVAAIDRTSRASIRGPQPRHEITCDVCGKTVMTGNSRGRYCSQRCRYIAGKTGLAAATGTTWERKHERTCELCGSVFMAAKQTAKFCSPACNQKNHRLRVAAGIAVERDKIFKRRCRMCLEPFETAREGALYCSANCRAAAVRDRRAKGLPAAGNPGAGVKATHVQKCDVCRREYMSAKRAGPFYCSPTCRSTAYYREHREEVLAKRSEAWAAKKKKKKARAR